MGSSSPGQAIPPSGNGQVLVAKYDSSGQLDPGFATQGDLPQRAAGGRWAIHSATAVARDCMRAAAWSPAATGQASVLVLRLTADGQLDNTFGYGRAHDDSAWAAIAESMAIQRDGADRWSGHPTGDAERAADGRGAADAERCG